MSERISAAAAGSARNRTAMKLARNLPIRIPRKCIMMLPMLEHDAVPFRVKFRIYTKPGLKHEISHKI